MDLCKNHKRTKIVLDIITSPDVHDEELKKEFKKDIHDLYVDKVKDKNNSDIIKSTPEFKDLQDLYADTLKDKNNSDFEDVSDEEKANDKLLSENTMKNRNMTKLHRMSEYIKNAQEKKEVMKDSLREKKLKTTDERKLHFCLNKNQVYQHVGDELFDLHTEIHRTFNRTESEEEEEEEGQEDNVAWDVLMIGGCYLGFYAAKRLSIFETDQKF